MTASTTPTEPAKELIEQTKKMVRNAIAAAVQRDDSGRAFAAGNLTDHLIDELVTKLKPTFTANIHLDAEGFMTAARRERDLIALRNALQAAQRIIDKGL